MSCDLGAKWTARTLSSSEKFDANAGCNGVWAIESYVYNDQVRGRFYKDGAWQTSSYSWQWVYWNGASQPKIVGNTTTGRDIKGQAANYDQYVIYEF